MQHEQISAILVSADARLVQLAQASAAAVGTSLAVVADADDLRVLWRTAPVVLIGADEADHVAGWALPRRERVYLVGQEGSYELMCRWSMPLGASVIGLPQAGKWLSRVIAGRASSGDAGTVVAVRGGSGGVGVSTLCAGLAMAAIERSHRVALVDCDPCGGGLDLLLGAENTPGWRWDKLRNATGQISDITAMLPKAEGITLVSVDRPDPAPIPDPAIEAVVDCLARSHDLVLVDFGRNFRPDAAMVGRSLIVAAQTVRSIAATRASIQGLDIGQCAIVIRKEGSISPADAAQALDLPLVAVLPTVAELAKQADRGTAPILGRRWKKACVAVLRWCLGESTGLRRI